MITFRCLVEAFDRPYSYSLEQVRGGLDARWEAKWSTDGKDEVVLRFDRLTRNSLLVWPHDRQTVWEIKYWRNGTMMPARQGDAFRVLATVRAVVTRFAREQNVDMFFFTGSHSTGHASLYGAMTKLAPGLGYSIHKTKKRDDDWFFLFRGVDPWEAEAKERAEDEKF